MRALKLALLASSNLDRLPAILTQKMKPSGVDLQCYLPAGFGQYPAEVISPNSGYWTFQPEATWFHVDFEDALKTLCLSPTEFSDSQAAQACEEAYGEIQQLITAVLTKSSQSVLVSAFAPPALTGDLLLSGNSRFSLRHWAQTLNDRLEEWAHREPRLIVVDYPSLLLEEGAKNLSDPRLWGLARMRLNALGLDALANRAVRYLNAFLGRTRKCLVLDLDNTLWGGILGQDGPDGIELGSEGVGLLYKEFQQEILNLWRSGVLIALCSKNNETEALQAIENHSHMSLRKKHLAAWKINWSDKAESIAQLAEELGLTPEGLVVIDDNPAERDRIRSAFPTVAVPDWPKDPADFRRALLSLSEFNYVRLSPEDLKRPDLYNARRERTELRKSVPSLEEFLRSLRMEASVFTAGKKEAARIAQLTQRTNQFTTTAKRYTEADLAAGIAVFGLSVKDRYGDEGLIGGAVLSFAGPEWTIENFVLSCRVIGRQLENVLVAYIAKTARQQGARTLRGPVIETSRNTPARSLYASLGFQQPDPKNTVWVLSLDKAPHSYPSCIAVQEPAASSKS